MYGYCMRWGGEGRGGEEGRKRREGRGGREEEGGKRREGRGGRKEGGCVDCSMDMQKDSEGCGQVINCLDRRN